MPSEIKTGALLEQPNTPELAPEHAEIPAASQQESVSEFSNIAPPPRAVSAPEIIVAKIADPMQKEVEGVLTENLGDIFKQLPSDRKNLFKQKGEVIAAQITGMIKAGMIQMKKILKLIREWLLIIPGVNKFFLEQEAKIKAEKIQQIYEREHTATT